MDLVSSIQYAVVLERDGPLHGRRGLCANIRSYMALVDGGLEL